MEDYKKEKKDVEEFINGTVKNLSKDNKEKAMWLIQGMVIGQGPIKTSLPSNISKRS